MYVCICKYLFMSICVYAYVCVCIRLARLYPTIEFQQLAVLLIFQVCQLWTSAFCSSVDFMLKKFMSSTVMSSFLFHFVNL